MLVGRFYEDQTGRLALARSQRPAPDEG